MSKNQDIHDTLVHFIEEWEVKFLAMQEHEITELRNSQNRSVKQIVGHMCDSASNNTHRIVHLHYQSSPFHFPNYATFGNNDRWIAIQNYQQQDWYQLVQLWKYTNLHIAWVMLNVDESKLHNEWQAGEDVFISMQAGIVDYLRHFKLHLQEIEEIMAQN